MEDIWYNILLNGDLKNILYLSSLNTISRKIYQNKHFWISKYKHDDLPYLENYPDHFIDYKKIKFAKDKAVDLTYHLSNFSQPINLQISLDNLYDGFWLPIEIINKIQSINLDRYDNPIEDNSFLNFNIDQGAYSIIFEFSLTDIQWDTDGSLELDTTIVTLNKNEFILYLTKFFYYKPIGEIDLDIDDEKAIDILYQ